MKNILVSILFTLITFCSYSQSLSKGAFLIGGNIDFSSYRTEHNFSNGINKSYNYEVSPDIGFFITDKFVVGSMISVGKGKSNSDNSEYKTFSFIILPFLRYYLKDGFFGFVSAGIGKSKMTQKSDVGNFDNTSKTKAWGVGLGYDFFVSKNIAFEVIADYGGYENDNANLNQKRLGIALGIQVFLDK